MCIFILFMGWCKLLTYFYSLQGIDTKWMIRGNNDASYQYFKLLFLFWTLKQIL